MRNSRALLGLLLLLTPAVIHAEEENPFFDKDFAKSPERDEAVSPLPPKVEPTVLNTAPLPSKKKSASEGLSERVKGIAQRARSQDSSTMEVPQATPLPGSKQTMQIALVGAILDGTKQELLAKQLNDFVAVLSGLNILASTVYCIGPRVELPVKTLYEITKLQGRVLFVDQQPDKYKEVKQSPTWILSSLDQEIIIEGAGLLSENLNLKGEITTRATEKVTPKSAPTIPRQP